jgi:large subunit ribosomal protein L10
MKTTFILATVASSAAAFTTHTRVQQRQSNVFRGRSSLNMGGASGFATSLEGKAAKVDAVKGLLDTSEMIFTVPASSLSVSDVQSLRRSLPEGTTMSVVKNTLFRRAAADTPYEEATAELSKGANMWFFIEEDIGGSVKAWESFTKESGKQETHSISGGVIEGVAYDTAGVKAISKLPSKIELITKIAGSIKAVPTKIARVIKANPEKLARAIKLATAEEESE